MQVADLVDDLQPGPLKDELLKDFKRINKRLPKMVEIEKGTGFSRSTISRKGLKPGVDYLTMGESQKLRVRDLPEEQVMLWVKVRYYQAMKIQ